MRTSWPRYFINIARAVATRATCDRLHVGCVLVGRDNNILATGYNGSMAGADHCDDVGHQLVGNHCLRTVHAEANAVTQAARSGTMLGNIDVAAYITHPPCWPCYKLLVNAGVREIIFGEFYNGKVDDTVATHTRTNRFSPRVLHIDVVDPVGAPEPEEEWQAETLVLDEFHRVRVTASRGLTDFEAGRLFGCIGYAFGQHLRGEPMGSPAREGTNRWVVNYDITKSRSDDWGAHFDDALMAARKYAREGTPVRMTDRQGPGTKGTRLIDGLGPITLSFEFA